MTAPIVLVIVALLALSGCEARSQTAGDSATNEKPPMAAPPQAQEQQRIDHCAGCHGRDGNGAKREVPYIGGQHPQYLGFAMRAYLNGLRNHSHMQAQLAQLTRKEIDQLATYFGQQPRRWRGMDSAPTGSQAPAPQTLEQGRRLSESCAACHGEKGISSRPEVPHLAGLDKRYLTQAIAAYIDGDRQNELMQVYKGTLTPSEIDTLASYYSSLTPAAASHGDKVRLTPALSAQVRRCAACHGRRASNVVEGIPHLAGQNRNYLRSAIRAYQQGTRKNPRMGAATAKLSPTEIDALADYYASLKPFKIPFGELNFSNRFAPLKDGAIIAASCNGCHQQPLGEAPNLNGLSPAYLQQAIRDYQQGARADQEMAHFVRHLNELDIEKVALYYATRPAPTVKQPAAIPPKAEALVESCNGCHGEQGNSANPTTPTLAGQKRSYLIKALLAYADKQRQNQQMADVATGLTRDEITTLANYYAGQTRTKINLKLPAPASRIAAKCDICHDEAGRSEDPNRPIIKGQNEAYLIEALESYRNGLRDNSAMFAMTDVLSTLEIHALARHYARQE